MSLPHLGRHVCRTCLPVVAESSRMAQRTLHFTARLRRQVPKSQREYIKFVTAERRARAQGLTASMAAHGPSDLHPGADHQELGTAAHPAKFVPQQEAPPLSTKAAAQVLWDGTHAWVADERMHDALRMFGVAQAELERFLPLFTHAARAELRQLIRSPTPELESLWHMPYVIDELAKSGKEAVGKAYIWRFLTWAPGHALEPGAAAAPSAGPLGHLLEIDRLLGSSAKQHLISPDARRLKRKIIMHVGPTNSGKTHQALQALVRAESGVYAGPLRLLAHEIWKRINNGAIDGIVRDCNLITGEEQRWVGEYAAHVACTVEMTPLKDWDVVVLDEIQMIADPDRGSSWMSVLLGAPAKEIHLCGEDTTVDLVTRIAKECGDEIVINRYERLSPLKIADKSLGGDLSKVQQGDAIVAFNRSFIFQLAQQVASKTGHSAALAYGALPPEVRNQQAKVFNDPNSGLSVMVASDAIGLGLNLKIKRIIFHRMTKWNGKEVIELSPSQTKQIAGRAGRFGLHGEGESGEVTTLFPADLPILRRAMGVPNSPILRGQIAPSSLIVIDFYRLLTPGTTIYDAQKVFADFTRTAPWQIASPMKQDLMFVPGENMLFQKFCQLPTDIQLDWMNSPWPKRQIWPLVAACADAFLKNYIERPEMVEIQPVLEQHGLYDPFAVIHLGRNTIRAAGAGPAMKRLLSNPRTLVYLESAHRAITFYLWLSYRFPVSFGEQLKAFELKNQVEDATQIVLAWTSSAPQVLENALNPSEDDRTGDYRSKESFVVSRRNDGPTRTPIPIDIDSQGRIVRTVEGGEPIPLQQRWEDASW